MQGMVPIWREIPEEIEFVGEGLGSGQSSSTSVTHGVNILRGDLILVVHANNSSATCVDNNGSNALTLDATETFNSNGSRSTVFSRIARDNEPATFNFTLSSSQFFVLSLRIYRGVDPDQIYDVTPASPVALGVAPKTPCSGL